MMEDHADGEGLTILFVHSFPELWCSWRHHMLSLSSLRYRTVAPASVDTATSTCLLPPSLPSTSACFDPIGIGLGHW
ncbi:hypothetical protein U1Q18_047649 [Sarracenia purpurea var. burkii]